MGDNVSLISPGKEAAKYLKKKLTTELRHDDTPDKNQYRFFVSDSIEQFEELGSIFLEKKIDGQVSKIDIEKY
jgi:glutamate racemase